jgi:predicted Zn-dependent peptidase
MSALLGSGSKNLSKDEFNKKIDFYGANVYLYDGGFYINSLSKYFPEILKLTADQAIYPKFSKEEFVKEKEKLIEGLKASEKSTPAAAQRVMQKLAFGQHPYGEVTEVNTVNNVKLEDVQNYYKKRFTPNHAYLIVVGDVNAQDVEKMAHQYFSDWQKAPQVRGVALPVIKNIPATEVDFVHMPNAEQTEIKVVHRSDVRKNNPDYQKVLLMNSILGGDFNSYLNMTLREKHGWTYGARSSFGTDKYGDLFRATTSVRNAVADSAVVVTMEQIDKIRNEKVDPKVLYNNKQKYMGNFVLKMEKPETIANQAYDMYVNNLPEDYYETFLQKIDAVTVDDIQQVAQKYLHPDKARIIVAGNASKTVPGLKKAGYKVKFYDKHGNPAKAPKTGMKIPQGVTVKTVIDNYINAIGGKDKINKTNSLMTVYEGKVQNMTLKMTNYAMKPNKSLTQMEAMGMVLSKEVFDGQNAKRMVQGRNMPVSPEELEKMKNTPQPFSELDLVKKGKLTQMANFDGNDYYVVTDDQKTTYYFNTKTGLLDKEVKHQKVQGRDMTQAVYYKDYKDVDGIKIPSKITISAGVQDMNFNLIDAKVNTLKPEDFK